MASRPDDSREKGFGNPELQPTRSGSDGTKATSVNQDENLSKWTKAGCTLESFKRREATGSPDLLNKTMKSRHLQMIASGGSIGAGFFVGSGSALFKGGPGTLLIDFLIMGVMIFNVVQALGELAVMYPVSGGFYTFSSRFIDPAWGFAMGWNYVFQWAVCLPLELVVASLTIAYWNSEINPAIWISVFLGALIIINIFGTLGYAEEEFWTSVIKLLTVIIFMIICFIFVLGGGPSKGIYSEYWGARLWYDPGAFKNGFQGFCSVFVTAAFSFAGTELVGLAAAESENPAKSLPGAIKQVFWRITIFYIIGLMFIGLLVSCTDNRLLGSGGMIDVNASPFVIVAINGGIKGFDHLLNGIILMSIISLGNSAIYGGSRTLTALADKGYAPKIFSYIDKSGRPLFSTIVLLAFGCLAYIGLSSSGDIVFEWLLALSGLSSLFTWASICLAHIRFRAAWKAKNRSLEEIPYKAAGGVYGSWCGLILIIVVIMAQFYTALFPLGNNGKIGSAEKFFQSFLAVPVVIIMYIIGWVWKRKSWWSIDDIDIETDLREVDWNTINEYRALIASYPAWKRVWYYLF